MSNTATTPDSAQSSTPSLSILYEVTTIHPEDKVFPQWISYFDEEAEALAQQQYSEYSLGLQSTINRISDIELEEINDL